MHYIYLNIKLHTYRPYNSKKKNDILFQLSVIKMFTYIYFTDFTILWIQIFAAFVGTIEPRNKKFKK